MYTWFFRNRVFLFLWAAMTGFLFAIVWKQYEQTIHETLTSYRITPSSFDYEWTYRAWLDSLGLTSIPHKIWNWPNQEPKNVRVTTEDQWLATKVPIFCIVLTKKAKQGKAVKNTWAKHCKKALFFGDFEEKSVPVHKIKGKNDWTFLCEALHSVWKHYSNDLKWVLVVGDRTFAIVQNLRYMVAGLDSNDSYYLGHAYKEYDGQYNVADAGYVLSWGALFALGRRFPRVTDCAASPFWHGSGDRTLGYILEQEGIRPRDTRDIMERSRFLPFNVEKLLIVGSISVFSHYWRESTSLSPEGSGCCSDFVITLSDVVGDKMYMLEYIIYHLKPVSHYWPPLPKATPKAKPTSTGKPKSIGKAFVKDLSASPGSKSNKGLKTLDNGIKGKQVSSSPKNSQKAAKGNQAATSKQFSGKKNVSDVLAINNGHMNKVAEMAAKKVRLSKKDDKVGVRTKQQGKYSKDDDYYNDNFHSNNI